MREKLSRLISSLLTITIAMNMFAVSLYATPIPPNPDFYNSSLLSELQQLSNRGASSEEVLQVIQTAGLITEEEVRMLLDLEVSMMRKGLISDSELSRAALGRTEYRYYRISYNTLSGTGGSIAGIIAAIMGATGLTAAVVGGVAVFASGLLSDNASFNGIEIEVYPECFISDEGFYRCLWMVSDFYRY